MAAKKPVSQSRTMWVKKGTMVNGKEVKKGYLAQYGKPEKKVSGTVALVTGGQGGMGSTKTYKAGRSVSAMKKKADAKKRVVTQTRPTGGGGNDSKPNGPKPPKVGELRKGPRGALNRWNGSRWVRASKGSTYQAGQGMTARPKTNSESTSTARSSRATGTYTGSYRRSSRGQMTVAAHLAAQTQRNREKRRAARMTKKK